MPALRHPIRPLLLAVAVVALVAIPVLAVGPRDLSPSPSASESAAASVSASPIDSPSAAPSDDSSSGPTPAAASSPTTAATHHPDQSASPDSKKDEGATEDEATVTVTGTVGTRPGRDEGETDYTLTVGTRVLVLDAGPSWFYGDKHPLKPFVGKRVTVVGEQEAGSDKLEVRSVDGTVIRADGKPPWAGGWKHVGKIHPGWSQEKWDRWQAKVAGKEQRLGVDCWPPGWCKPTNPGTSSTERPAGGS
jgi:hypothetical protein